MIEDPYRYSRNAAKDREKRVIVATKSKLDVTNVYLSDAGRLHAALLLDEDLEMKELKTYLNTASSAEKLALIRDYNLEYLKDEKAILKVIKEEMKSLDLIDELARLQAVYSI